MDSKDQPNKPDEQPEEQPQRIRLNRHNYHSLIDQIFAKAQADGLMDNLPGQGQPLKLDDDEHVPDEYRLGFRMLKSSGFAPPWIEARRELDEERARIDAWIKRSNERWPYLEDAARTKLRAEHRRKLDDLQRQIITYNLNAPPGATHIEGLRMEDELRKLGGA